MNKKLTKANYMNKKLTIALDRYDRHFPIFLKQVAQPNGLEINPLEVGMVPPRMSGVNRHNRMLIKREFDAAETSLSSYIIARDQGLPFTAIPIFPRRLFSQNHIFVKSDSSYSAPQDLIGKKILVWAFQVTMSVLAKADFLRSYDVNWRDIHWYSLAPEEVSVSQLPVTLLPSGSDPAQLLLEGKIDAYIYPHPQLEMMSGKHGIRRLFHNLDRECNHYYKKFGYFPIMHTIAINNDALIRLPMVPEELMKIMIEAKQIADDYYHDPGFSLNALTRLAYERQRDEWSSNIWPDGIEKNRSNLEWFIEAMYDQGLISRIIPVEELFHVSTHGT